MLLKVLKGKLHRARITETRLHYPGSIEIDSALMEASGILPYESVLVANLNNGSRLRPTPCRARPAREPSWFLGPPPNWPRRATS